MELGTYAAEVFLNYVDHPNLSDVFITIIVWTLGEFGSVTKSQEVVIEKIAKLVERQCSRT